MNEHDHFKEMLPFYTTGQLEKTELEQIQQHLAQCPECQADLATWKKVAGVVISSSREVIAPSGLAQRTLAAMDTPPSFSTALIRVWNLLKSQALLLRSELWTASAAVMAIGVTVALFADKEQVIRFIAPMVAAACLAVIYGPENDPALELALSAPTSPWKILLARLTLVSGYNMAITLAASLVLIVAIPQEILQTLILSWFGPMTFLSALALLLSIWIGANNALTIVYGLWLAQYINPIQTQIGRATPAWEEFFTAYRGFWQNPLPLVIFSLPLLILALWSASRMQAPNQKHGI